MPDLKIKNADPALITRLDDIVNQKGYSDRSELMREVLEKNVRFGDKLYANELPDTVNILLKDTLSDYPDKLSKLLQCTLEMLNENTCLFHKIEQYFEPENGDL